MTIALLSAPVPSAARLPSGGGGGWGQGCQGNSCAFGEHLGVEGQVFPCNESALVLSPASGWAFATAQRRTGRCELRGLLQKSS